MGCLHTFSQVHLLPDPYLHSIRNIQGDTIWTLAHPVTRFGL